MTNPTVLPDLEKSLNEIQTLVEQMEKGDLSLEQSLNQFERGITLIRHAQTLLSQAEHKVKILLNQNGQDKLTSYESTEE